MTLNREKNIKKLQSKAVLNQELSPTILMFGNLMRVLLVEDPRLPVHVHRDQNSHTKLV